MCAGFEDCYLTASNAEPCWNQVVIATITIVLEAMRHLSSFVPDTISNINSQYSTVTLGKRLNIYSIIDTVCLTAPWLLTMVTDVFL